MTVHIFGIRHHGPGSARSLRRALEALEPDQVLVEGPPDADRLLPLVGHPDMKPPVALIVYAPEATEQAVYYPFVAFSPEWQAIRYALERGVPVRFMDLPQMHRAAIGPGEREASTLEPGEMEASTLEPEAIPVDPIAALARAAGFEDSERWWEYFVEHRPADEPVFEAILEAMSTLREVVASDGAGGTSLEALREAWMRQAIRAAEKEGRQRIAVVCGAWHAPALRELSTDRQDPATRDTSTGQTGAATREIPNARQDAALLRSLPKRKLEATWIPWTYGRLTLASGYGAGIESPGWYDHLWRFPDQPVIHWMSRVARLLRDEDLDVSSARVIDAVRLADALAALRELPMAGLRELIDAALAALCGGADAPLRLVHDRLVVGETLGAVPDETPAVPLQQDLARLQRRLKLAPEATEKALDLDLRKPFDLERSHLLHRLELLEFSWGRLEPTRGKLGTFHEQWRLAWRPELALSVIEAALWGNTVIDAATARAAHDAAQADGLPALSRLAGRALLADLAGAIEPVMHRLEAAAAMAADIAELMEALLPLARVVRYGSVRQTDRTLVAKVVDGLVARVCIGLPGACVSIDDDAATEMLERIIAVNGAVSLIQRPALRDRWWGALAELASRPAVHPLIAGHASRLLLDTGVLDRPEAARRLSVALSAAVDPIRAGAWIEGFLRGSGLLLLHDDALWEVLDAWVSALPAERFMQVLPLLRRTFSGFSGPERRQLGERARVGVKRAATRALEPIDTARAARVLPVLRRLLGSESAIGHPDSAV